MHHMVAAEIILKFACKCVCAYVMIFSMFVFKMQINSGNQQRVDKLSK